MSATVLPRIVSSPFWQEVFGNPEPVEIEIGPGRGDVLLAFASGDPSTNFFGIEHKGGQATAIADRAGATGLHNVRVVGGDARCIVTTLVPDASVAAYHVYCPDPWPKNRHRKRLLFSPAFVAALARTLAPEGRVHVASDLEHVYARMHDALVAGTFAIDPGAPVRPRPVTKFERKYGQGRIHGAAYRYAAVSPHRPTDLD